jgi:uncharacterized protein YjdB
MSRAPQHASRGLLAALLCGAALACGGTPGLASLTLTPGTLALVTGGSQTVTATGAYDDGSHRTLGEPDVAFTSSALAVATIDATGLVHAIGKGTATLTATATTQSGAPGRTASATVTVTDPPPTLVSIALAGATTALELGATAQLTVTGAWSDGSHTVLSSGVTFTSLAPAIASVSAAGLVTGLAPGVTSVTASASGAPGATRAVSVVGPHRDVFVDGIAQNLNFVPFDGTASSDLTPDSAVLLANGHKTLRFTFQMVGSSIGGALVAGAAQDLTGYDAITFWAKASAPLTLETVGLGNDATGSATGTRWSVETSGLALDTTFQQFTVPLPLAAKLTAQTGLFHFADANNHSGIVVTQFWIGDLRYQTLGATVTGAPAPSFTLTTHDLQAGHTLALMGSDLQIAWTGGAGSLLTLVRPSLAYFTYSSSDATVATVSADGVLSGVKAGQAAISAKLGAVQTSNTLAVTVTP